MNIFILVSACRWATFDAVSVCYTNIRIFQIIGQENGRKAFFSSIVYIVSFFVNTSFFYNAFSVHFYIAVDYYIII